jgi:AcrR family transcriptional regulator
VIRAAVSEFSIRGLEGTSTSDIAKRVGVSQPYLFRLFPTKKALFIEACLLGSRRIEDAFVIAAEGKWGREAMSAMGEAYQELLESDREVLMMQLQQFAACHDPGIQDAVRGSMSRVWQRVENLSGAPVEEMVEFFATGMLCNMIAATGVAEGVDPVWDPVLESLKLRGGDCGPDGEGDGADVDADAEPGVGPDVDDEARRRDEWKKGYAEYAAAKIAGKPAGTPG